MITIEGSSVRIIDMNPEKECIEVVENGALFKGKVFEVTCENNIEHGYVHGKTTKVVLYNYTVEKLEKGYIEKKTIKKALDKIYEDNDGLYMDMDENVDVIYSELEKEGLFGDNIRCKG